MVTDYLGLTVVYENIAEDDPNKIAFLSNGKRPLWVSRNEERIQVVFPKGTVVMDKVLLHENESSRRRFTLGHEGAHSVIAKQNPMQDVGCFHNEFDPERVYTIKEQKELMSFSETQADRLSSVFLMPRFILRKVMKKYKCENGLPVYGWNVFAPEDKLKLRKMADCMGVSFQALVIRLKTLGLLIPRDLTVYLENGLPVYGWNVFAPEDKQKLRKMADCMGVSFQALVIRLKTLGLLMPRDLTVYLENDLQLGGAK